MRKETAHRHRNRLPSRRQRSSGRVCGGPGQLVVTWVLAVRSSVRVYGEPGLLVVAWVLAVGLLAGAPTRAWAGTVHELPVRYGSSTWDSSELRDRVSASLAERLVDLRSAESTHALVVERLVVHPDETTDIYIRTSLDSLSAGRDAFFEGDAETTLALIAPRLDALEHHPEVVAFRPDFIPVLIESFLVLHHAYVELDRPDEADRTLRSVARLFPYAPLDEWVVPPPLIATIERMRGELLVRALSVHWLEDDACVPWVNGSPVPTLPGGVVRLIGNEAAFLQLRCEGYVGHVFRVDASVPRFEWTVAFDDALRVSAARTRLEPRSHVEAALLPELLRAAGRLLGRPLLSMARVPAGLGEPDTIEFGYVNAAGGFRGIRVSDDQLRSARGLTATLDYLFGYTDTPPEPAIVWKTDPAWVPIGAWSMSEGIVRTRSTRRGSAAVGWSLMLVGASSAAVSGYLIADTRRARRTLDGCEAWTCLGTDEMLELRQRVERREPIAVITGAAAVVSVVTGTTLLSVRARRNRSDRRSWSVRSASLGVSKSGVRAAMSLGF